MEDSATHALTLTATMKHAFNNEEENVIIRNGWIPEEEEKNFSSYINKTFDFVHTTYGCLEVLSWIINI